MSKSICTFDYFHYTFYNTISMLQPLYFLHILLFTSRFSARKFIYALCLQKHLVHLVHLLTQERFMQGNKKITASGKKGNFPSSICFVQISLSLLTCKTGKLYFFIHVTKKRA